MRRTFTICLLLTVGLAGSAHAGWSRPVTVGQAPEDPRLSLTASPGPGAALSWVGDDPLAVTVRRLGRRGGALGPAKVVSAPLEDLFVDPNIAMDARGRVVASWSVSGLDSTTIFARRMGAGGRLGPLHTVAQLPYALDAGERLAIDAAGTATIAWEVGPGFVDGARVQLRRLGADGRLGPIVDVPSDGAADFNAALAVEGSGRGVLAWVQRGPDGFTVRAALLDRAGNLGPARDVSAPQENWSGAVPSVAVARTGRATVVWRSTVEEPLYARQLTASRLGPVARLARDTAYFGPRVAMDAAGGATVVWLPAYSTRVELRRFTRRGALGPERALSPVDPGITWIDLAVDALGNATVAWSAPEGRVRRVSRRGRAGRTRTLARAGVPLVAADASGHVTAAWQSGSAILASRFALLR